MIIPNSYHVSVLLFMMNIIPESGSNASNLYQTKVGLDRGVELIKKNYRVNLTEARQALCPVVGYQNSHYCPSMNEINNRKRTSRSTLLPPLLLPRGVGMTIDISTGKIALPALELTYSDAAEKLWTDPYSKQSFIVPKEVLLTDVPPDENQITVNIFKTEVDLVSVWTRNADDGYWTGGEFGVAKTVLDVYTDFFTGNQATSISQNPFGLYILTMISGDSPTNLALNKYAKAAVDGLSPDYDEEIYKAFMDAWGTHIAISTKIGGMKEQQATLKNCIWSSPYYTGGISIDDLKEYLKQDLLSQTPCDSYYLSRRKLIMDHLIGGNLELQDIELWKKTVAFDPALLKVIKYIPWYDVISDVTIKKNLRKAMTTRINASNVARMSKVDQVTSQRTSLLQRSAQYGVRTNYYGATKPAYEIGDKIVLGNTSQCPDRLSRIHLEKYCNTGKNITACSVAYANFQWMTTWDVPLCYERNRTTGSFRAVARRAAGEILSELEGRFRNYDLYGPWIESGCSWIKIPCKADGRGITDAFICAGCIPATDRDKKIFSCPCPPYDMDPGFQPYCK